MKCNKCQNEIIHTDKFCGFCGEKNIVPVRKSNNQVTPTPQGVNENNKKVMDRKVAKVSPMETIGKFIFATFIIFAFIYGFIGSCTKDSGSNRSTNIHDYDYTETTIIKDNKGNIIDTEVWEGNRVIEAKPYN